MKKIIALGLAIVLLLSLGVGGAFAADNNPNASAKATAQITELALLQAAYADDTTVPGWSGWTILLKQTIKTANKKDLFIDVSLLSGLYTETNVKSKGSKDTSAAAAAVLLWVKVDGIPVHPEYPIIFNARVQKLAATLGGFGTDFATPEEIELLIGTLSANSFNFIAPDLDSGMHTVTVETACWAGATAQEGSAIAGAAIGLGSVTIEEVRMIKGEDWLME